MNVLLISCYELGHQPHGLASPAGHIVAKGIPLECLDLAVQPLDEEEVARADFVGISVPMHTAIRLGVKAAARVRSLNGGAHICFYGLYASLNANHLLRTCADSVVGGEFELPLVELIESIAKGADWENRPPVGVRTRSVTAPPFLGRQQFLPPDRSLLPPLGRYARLDIGMETLPAGYVEASRGCAHACLHCPITPVYAGKFRVVQEGVVRQDIAAQVGCGARHITFGDPDFLNGVRHSLRVARNLHEDFPDVTFDITAKIEHILEHAPVLEELASMGCVFIVSAVESVNDTILRHLRKGHTRADVVKALEITDAAAIALRPSLLSFTPWTSLEDYLEMLEFVEDHDLIERVDPVHYSIRLLVPPGSSLLEEPQMIPFLGSLDEEEFSYHWDHPDPRMDLLHEEVSDLVERAHRESEVTYETFYRIKELTSAALGVPSASRRPPVTPRRRTPRLTESWFC